MSSPSWDYIAKLVCIGDSGCGKSSLTIRLCEGRFVAHHDVTIGVEFGSRIVPVGPPHTKDYVPTLTPATTAATAAPSSLSSSSSTTFAPVGNGNGAAANGGLPSPPRKGPAPPPQKHMKLSLWDTAGQETYKSVTRSYFRGASGALLVFDLSRRQTFQHVTDWLNDLRQIAEPDIVVVLVGNKADLALGRGGEEEEDGGGAGAGRGEGGGTGGDDGTSSNNKHNKREVTREEAQDWARRNGVLEYVETSAKSGEGVERAFMRVAERIYQNIQAGKYDLNDRRSGVKGPSAGGARQVRLSTEASHASAGGGCC